MNAALSFVLADCQDITRMGMRFCIMQTYPDAEIIELNDISKLIDTLTHSSRAIIVLDYMSFGLKTADSLSQLIGRINPSMWILFADQFSDTVIRHFSTDFKVSMLLKTNSREEIVSALRCAVRGERFLCPQITNLLISPYNKSKLHASLTRSELDVLCLIARGKSVKEIAEERHTSAQTVVTHKRNIYKKLKINSAYQATKYALQAGLVEILEYYI